MSIKKEARYRALRSIRAKERADALHALNAALDIADKTAVDREMNSVRMAEMADRLAALAATAALSGGRMARALENRRQLRVSLQRYRSVDATLAGDLEWASRDVEAAKGRVALAQRALRVLEKEGR